MARKAKVCGRCGVEKPLTRRHFQRDRTTTTGYHPVCKVCRSAYDRERDRIRNKLPHRRLQQRCYSVNGRARKADIAGVIVPDDIRFAYLSTDGKCYWCGVALGGRWHVDHVLALALGGLNVAENICVACPSCNSRKNGHALGKWLGMLAASGVLHPDTRRLGLSVPVQLDLFAVAA